MPGPSSGKSRSHRGQTGQATKRPARNLGNMVRGHAMTHTGLPMKHAPKPKR